MARLRTRKVVPQTVPDEDFILDDIGDASLDVREFLCVGFVLFCFFFAKKCFLAKVSRGPNGEGAFSVVDGPTRTEMRWRNAGCGCTIVGYGHRRNNVAFQQGGAPVIGYRDATGSKPAQTSTP